MNQAEIGGWFISFTEKQLETVCAMLRDGGYEQTPVGLKKMILELDEEPPEAPDPAVGIAGLIGQWAKDHPEQVAAGIGKVKKIIGSMARKRS